MGVWSISVWSISVWGIGVWSIGVWSTSVWSIGVRVSVYGVSVYIWSIGVRSIGVRSIGVRSIGVRRYTTLCMYESVKKPTRDINGTAKAAMHCLFHQVAFKLQLSTFNVYTCTLHTHTYYDHCNHVALESMQLQTVLFGSHQCSTARATLVPHVQ